MNQIIRTTGIVKEILDNGIFKITLEDGTEISATISGKAKLYLSYEIYQGEEVPIELSPYDRSRGRINPRGWKRKPPE